MREVEHLEFEIPESDPGHCIDQWQDLGFIVDDLAQVEQGDYPRSFHLTWCRGCGEHRYRSAADEAELWIKDDELLRYCDRCLARREAQHEAQRVVWERDGSDS